MSRTKLKKFKKLKDMPHVIQPSHEELLNDNFSLKGKWKDTFNNNNPIVLELGCGKGEYTIALSKMFPEYNYVAIDIKGSRLYSGAEIVNLEKIQNVIFIRTQIEYLESLFTKDEIQEIWIPFPDPQIKYQRRKKRLTGLNFLQIYKQVLKKNGVIHLKTDSMFLYGYTLGLLEAGPYKIIENSMDIYHINSSIDKRLKIKTHYEKMFLDKNKLITYLAFSFL